MKEIHKLQANSDSTEVAHLPQHSKAEGLSLHTTAGNKKEWNHDRDP